MIFFAWGPLISPAKSGTEALAMLYAGLWNLYLSIKDELAQRKRTHGS